MATKAGKEIAAALGEVLAHVEGQPNKIKIYNVRIPALNVKAIRKKTGLSQDNFARYIGVNPGTLRNWEQGIRKPSGAAQILLALLKEDPEIVQNTLAKTPARKRVPA